MDIQNRTWKKFQNLVNFEIQFIDSNQVLIIIRIINNG